MLADDNDSEPVRPADPMPLTAFAVRESSDARRGLFAARSNGEVCSTTWARCKELMWHEQKRSLSARPAARARQAPRGPIVAASITHEVQIPASLL
mmetsp:Transcript_24324/g.80843  ORF Transcript_24324/g.80843 Transcript_24324/m.80843 type:complete len:96 (-) Transcript_24324:310-597(-)